MACGSDGGGGGGGTGGANTGGSSAMGGQGGATGGTGGTGGAGGAAGGGLGGAAGFGGAAGGGAAGSGGVGGSGSGGAPPMCSTSAECKDADVSYPGSTEPATSSPTDCVGGQCGLVTNYSGAYKTPKTPRSCTDICAASTYDGKPMACAASCQTKVSNGFGDKSLVHDAGADAGAGSVAGLLRYQFSPISGAYKFQEVSCSETPKSKLIIGSNSYTYVGHQCCCVAP